MIFSERLFEAYHFSMKFSSQNIAKMAQLKITVAAADKSFGRQNYLRVQEKLSAGNFCLGFPQLNRENLTAGPHVSYPRISLRYYNNEIKYNKGL